MDYKGLDLPTLPETAKKLDKIYETTASGSERQRFLRDGNKQVAHTVAPLAALREFPRGCTKKRTPDGPQQTPELRDGTEV